MSFNNSDEKPKQEWDSMHEEIELLKRENEKLKSQFEQVKQEQINYLQNVSHQLVAPLNAIKWHIENLTAGRLKSTERIQKVFRSIYSQSTISVHLAKNFALMSNLEADHKLIAIREPLEPVNLCRLLVNLADDFQPLGWDKNVHIQVIDEPLQEAPPVSAMKQLISQVFSNIIENAVKYSHSLSEILINGQFNADNNTVTVNISNKGIPLPSEEIQQIFTRGYRTKDAQNIYPAGTGFGLYIAKKIVDIHNGQITAFTDPDGRAVFQVTLSVKSLEG